MNPLRNSASSLPRFGLLQSAEAAQLPTTVELGTIAGFAVASLIVAALASLSYRWYVREPIPRGLATLVGVAVVAFSLNTIGLFGQVIGNTTETDPFAIRTVVVNVVSLGAAVLAAPVGRRLGDRAITDVVAVSGADYVEGEVSRAVRTLGRVTAIELPAEIEDIEGYDPIPSATKERFAGTTMLFPRRRSGEPLRDLLVDRLKEEYGIGHVDVELDGNEAVRLAVGARVAGLGPTLGPGTCAVAVRADPPNGASPGEAVQVWTDGEKPERIATAELRATAGDVVTIAVDESDAAAFENDRTYRLLTLPADPRADREFASLLRAADETMGVVTVSEGSALVGATVESVGSTVVAVRPATGPVETIPGHSLEMRAGDTLYVVARPEELRDLESRAAVGGADVEHAGAQPS
ncbi:TrkA C-terminal domain-containing protein [Halorarum halophilum]|uniref:TrkA C-terminal domain-containing protein n=1 Tax=Halorarum halophilum TaxID=2743090 RepID=A0A7D5GA46_9EURY|nr:TrkA C-terminal domain-containing protein [Halobaculum halophilum]QLG26326.1 TrkA C-terminal domain-containing protein [Halobaculum halophilum]